MDSENLNSFYADAAVNLAGIRNGILVFIQERKAVGELDPALRALNDMTAGARKLGLADIESLASECERHVDHLVTSEGTAADVSSRRALDNLARIEASLLNVPLNDRDFWTGIADTVDDSFEKFQSAVSNAPGDPVQVEAFDIDGE